MPLTEAVVDKRTGLHTLNVHPPSAVAARDLFDQRVSGKSDFLRLNAF